VAVDKTGTLTEGRPALVETRLAKGIAYNEALHLAASLEQGSPHPLAVALVAAAREAGIGLALPVAVQSAGGKGVSGEVAGRQVAVGSPAYLTEAGVAIPADQLDLLTTGGLTPVCVAADGRLLALFGVADRLRPGAAEAVARLRRQGLRVVMLTGDHPAVAQAIARQVGIDEFRAQVLPADKAAAVQALRNEGRVGMVGDGINDAPALAAADVSFAIGAGSDVAVEAADVTLVRSDPAGVADAIALSRATLGKIRQNLFFAFIYNILGIPAAALGLLNPVIAAAAMAMSSVSVVSNSLLLRRWRPGQD
ncbi:MAG TPA: HAD-IC family P-type ATPase, partial [Rhodocyclaceae bacterium]|nr:HAD-IC family P-type ATPase [Rhodocyclaceae bacterium]